MTHIDLLDAVDALTQPVRVKVIQDDGKVVAVEHSPLLTQLEEAIRGSMVGIGGSSSLANERGMLNSGALFEFSKIASQIGDWCRMVGLIPTREPITDLRKWHVETLKDPDTFGEFYTKQLHGWAKLITDTLNPPRKRDLPNPCPECKATTWWEASTGEEHQRPLIILIKPDEEADQATAKCRACDHTWNARELAYELEVQDTPE